MLSGPVALWGFKSLKSFKWSQVQFLSHLMLFIYLVYSKSYLPNFLLGTYVISRFTIRKINRPSWPGRVDPRPSWLRGRVGTRPSWPASLRTINLIVTLLNQEISLFFSSFSISYSMTFCRSANTIATPAKYKQMIRFLILDTSTCFFVYFSRDNSY